MPEISAGDTAWVLMSAALVMLMTPGLALFYGGLVRRKNVLSTIMHSFFILALVSVTWVLWGYTLAFGPDTGLGLIGGLDWLALEGVTGEPSTVYATTVPHLAFMAFQMMFAIITPALITGAFAERKRFKAFVLFAVALVDARLRADRPLGLVAGRLALRPRRPRLRRRHRRPPLERRRRARGRALHRAPQRPHRAGHRAARRADDGPRRRPALVRLVRLQRRLGARRERPGGHGVRDHEHGRRDGGHHLGHDLVAASRHAVGARRGDRRRWPASWRSRRRPAT